MGTHPIFESDFDCLTELMGIGPSRLSENIQLYLGSIRDATDKKKTERG